MKFDDCSAALPVTQPGQPTGRICGHPSSDSYKKRVVPPICRDCPVRTTEPFNPKEHKPAEPTTDFKYTVQPNGTIIYEKTGWEPPQVPEGYVADEKNPWVLRPAWPECDKREQHTWTKQSCGCAGVKMICRHPDSVYFNDGVSLSICEQCPIRGIHNSTHCS